MEWIKYISHVTPPKIVDIFPHEWSVYVFTKLFFIRGKFLYPRYERMIVDVAPKHTEAM